MLTAFWKSVEGSNCFPGVGGNDNTGDWPGGILCAPVVYWLIVVIDCNAFYCVQASPAKPLLKVQWSVGRMRCWIYLEPLVYRSHDWFQWNDLELHWRCSSKKFGQAKLSVVHWFACGDIYRSMWLVPPEQVNWQMGMGATEIGRISFPPIRINRIEVYWKRRLTAWPLFIFFSR